MPLYYQIPFAIAFIGIVAVAYYLQMRALRRRRIPDAQRRVAGMYFGILAVVFLAGAVARVAEQRTGSQSLDAMVAILMGIWLCLLGAPGVYRLIRPHGRTIKSVALSSFVLLAIPCGIALIWLGVGRLVSAAY